MTKTVAVIGLGSIGMRHAKNLRILGHHVWGIDPDMSKRLDLGYEYTSGYIDHLRSADAFVIASPTSLHASYIIDAGGKPIFLEKPVADIELAGLPSNVLMVGYNLRFHSCVKKAKEWLASGLIGEPIWSTFTCAQYNAKHAYLRDGVILNWSHEIDLALYLLGPAKVAASSTRLTDDKDDMTDILLTHGSGCRSSIHLDYLTHPEERGFNIFCRYGSIKCNLVSRSVTLTNCDGCPEQWHIGKDTFDENYAEEMEAFISRSEGKETIGATGAEGLAVLATCLEVRKQAGL